MLPKYHAEITRAALQHLVSDAALKKIIAANLYQDRIVGQIGHDEYHFDNNAFEKSYAYIEEQRALVAESLRSNNFDSAWAAFGRLTHTAQDFYAHSNYVDLWLAHHNGTSPAPPEIDPVDQSLIDSPALRSGKIYPLELLSFIPGLKSPVLSRLPRDAHGWMNLDSPKEGYRFDFAFHAAVKRTMIEFERTKVDLPDERVAAFIDRP